MNSITIYSTATCVYCRMLKKFLDDHGIKYEVKLADENQDYAKELLDKSGQLGVPFSIIEGENGEVIESILGFDVHKFNDFVAKGILQKS